MKSKGKHRRYVFGPRAVKFVINAIAPRTVINPRRNRTLQVRSAKEWGARTVELMQLESFGVAERVPLYLEH